MKNILKIDKNLTTPQPPPYKEGGGVRLEINLTLQEY
jgi:hypothetical protein